MREIRVGSGAELHERLFEDSWQESLGRHRSNFAYRGRALASEVSRRASSGSAAT